MLRDLYTPRFTRDLQRIIRRINVRHCIDQAEGKGADDDKILPNRILVNHDRLLLPDVFNACRPKAAGTVVSKITLDTFYGAFGQSGRNSTFLHLDLNFVGNLNRNVMVIHLGDFSQHAAIGHNLVTFV